MRRTIVLVSVLCLAGLVLVACSPEVGPTDPEMYDKEAPPEPISDFPYVIEEAFETLEMDTLELDITFNRFDGGEFEGRPDSYPIDAPIFIRIEGDSVAPVSGGDEDAIIRIIVPIGPLNRDGILETPDGVILYQAENLPLNCGIAIDLPIMPYYDTSRYTGHFSTYDLKENEDGELYFTNFMDVSMEAWPPIAQGEFPYISFSHRPESTEGEATERKVGGSQADPDG